MHRNIKKINRGVYKMAKVSVIGAGGKMGARTSNNLAKKPDEFELLMAEASEAGIKSIKERGLSRYR